MDLDDQEIIFWGRAGGGLEKYCIKKYLCFFVDFNTYILLFR